MTTMGHHNRVIVNKKNHNHDRNLKIGFPVVVVVAVVIS